MNQVFEWVRDNRDVLGGLSALVTIAIALAGVVSRSVRRALSALVDVVFSFLPTVRHTSKLKKYVRKGAAEAPLWSYRQRRNHVRDEWPVVITMMNFKGGVGKTTLTANLAASLAKKHRLRVWVVDLDYQGSLTYMARSVATSEGMVLPNGNLMGDLLAAESRSAIKQLRPAPFYKGFRDAKILTAAHDLAEIEDNVLQKWLLHIEEPRGDVRSRFSTWLNLIKQDEELPQIIILDAPPRLSLSAVNALVASDFVLVPTVPQQTSIEPIPRLFDRLLKLKSELKIRAEVLGIVFNMADKKFDPMDSNEDHVKTVVEALEKLRGAQKAPHIFRSTIPQAVAISQPGSSERLAYADEGRRGEPVRDKFDELSTELLEQLRCRLPNRRIEAG